MGVCEKDSWEIMAWMFKALLNTTANIVFVAVENTNQLAMLPFYELNSNILIQTASLFSIRSKLEKVTSQGML